MADFLIDVNLPRYFSLWNSNLYLHQYDLGDEWTDEQIWRYAATNNLTIITKDSDFSNKILLHQPPPKIIHIRFGNIRMNEFFDIVTKLWDDVLVLNQDFKLVNVYRDRIEAFQ